MENYGCCPTANAVSHAAWDKGVTPRINRLRNQYWTYRPTLDLERAVSYTETYKKTDADDAVIRRAKAFHSYFSTKTVAINPDELIVGSLGKAPRSALFCPELSWRWLYNELDTLSTRPQDPYQVTEEDKKVLREVIFPYWKGKSVDDYFLANLPSDLAPIVQESGAVFLDFKSTCGTGDHAPGYENIILKKGYRGIQMEAAAYLAQIDPYDQRFHDKRRFYEAVIVICDAMRVLGERHAAAARAQAASMSDPARKAELLEIADICSRVPYEPPKTFREALQTIWFSQIAAFTEENATSISLGRVDQYLLPYYRQDLFAGILTKETAQELIECFWLKLAELIFVISKETAAAFSGYQPYCGITVGGCDKYGRDATNDLSYMFLQATMDLQMHVPTNHVRMSAETPESFVLKVCDLISLGTGQPAVFFDESAVKMMENLGLSLEDARNVSFTGCVEPSVSGKVSMWNEGGRFNFGSAVEWALWNGRSKLMGNRQFGLATGDAAQFTTYEQFEAAVQKQLEYMIKVCCLAGGVTELTHARLPQPYKSITTEGCLEAGADILTGCATYNIGPGMESTGITDLADSLAAVKKLVFEEKAFTMAQLLEALDRNFEGHEKLRQMLINDAPKYGNDDPYVDNIAAKFDEIANKTCSRYTSTWGTPYIHGVVPVLANVVHGEVISALPSGRKAGEPLADGISPYPSYDRLGPTAVVKSVATLPHANNGCGTLLNMKFSPSLLKHPADKKNLAALLYSQAKLGCYHIQFNVVSRETLLDAMEHPENYRDLLVRVAGYSAYFVDLRKESQQSIVDRTEHSRW